MKVKDLKEYLNNFSDDAKIVRHEWTNNKSVWKNVELCVNFEHQRKNDVVMLRDSSINPNY